MAVVTFILGESGRGKTRSLHRFNPQDVLLIQAIKKRLPFRSPGWKTLSKDQPDGCIYSTDNTAQIIAAMKKTRRQVIIIDDFQYTMANEFMRRAFEKGYEKFTEIGRNAWELVSAAVTDVDDDKRVYVISHTDQAEDGRTKIKTIGKMVDDKINLEGMVTIVLKSYCTDGKYYFATQNDGNDTTKSPEGMFGERFIENDLLTVDNAICDYYGIEPMLQPLHEEN